MLKKSILCCFLLTMLVHQAMAQIGFYIPKGKSKVEFPFEYINNFIVVTVDYKGFFPLRFILDTGAEHTILTKPEIARLFNMQFERTFTVLGSDMKTELTAHLVRRVPFSIRENIKSAYQDILVLDEDLFRFEEYVGTPVHGILSAKTFSRYLLQINYDQRTITLLDRNKKARYLKDYEAVPIVMSRNKPYLDTQLFIEKDSAVQIRLLLDTGAALGMILFPSTHEQLEPPPNALQGAIGRGLGGNLEGFTGRLHRVEIGDNYKQEGIISHFQELDTVNRAKFLNQRNGIMGNVILDRFRLVFDYQDSMLYVQPSRKYARAYKFDKSGLHCIATGAQFNRYLVQYVVPKSPAAEAGFQKGDELRSINRMPTKMLSFQGLLRRLQRKEGKKLRIKIQRDGKKMVKWIELRELL